MNLNVFTSIYIYNQMCKSLNVFQKQIFIAYYYDSFMILKLSSFSCVPLFLIIEKVPLRKKKKELQTWMNPSCKN